MEEPYFTDDKKVEHDEWCVDTYPLINEKRVVCTKCGKEARRKVKSIYRSVDNELEEMI